LATITSVLEGKDTLTIMPTGGGKSLCYQIPALYSEGVVIVISPLISLMKDQVTGLKEHGIKACFLNSSQSASEKESVKSDIKSGHVNLVYVSPEGILSPGIYRFLQNFNISLIAIDEAHCVSQWGHEFRADYIRLGELKTIFPNVTMLALTATADEKTRGDISLQLGLNSPTIFVDSFDRPNIKYQILERADEIKQLDQFIKANHSGECGIVYCLSRKKVERVAEKLCQLGHNAVCYHAGLSTEVRERSQDLFNTEEDLIVVATIAFGMGIDRPDVRFVAHLDLPKSIEGYYQETGRAGRDGRPSNAWMVYGLQDVVKLSQMLETTQAIESYKKVARAKLDSMLCLCESVSCRRIFLLSYFGQKLDQDCGNCDSCLVPADTCDATEDAQKILSAIYRTNQIYGAGYIIDVLRGSKNAKVLERGHDQLSVFGIGKSRSKTYLGSILRQLLNQGFIRVKNWEYRNFCLTEKSKDLLSGAQKLEVRVQRVESKKSTKKTKSTRHIDTAHDNDDLFEELRSIRLELAKKASIPPYIIFSDKSLRDMCLLLPRDKTEFLMVNGVGQNKCDRYAESFLPKISEYL